MKKKTDSTQIMNSTVGLLRSSWKASFCIFFQRDDHNLLRVKAADGIPAGRWESLSARSTSGSMAQCLDKNKVIEISDASTEDGLETLLKPFLRGKSKKCVLVPVSGQARVLGVLLMGPFPKDLDIKSRETELRSAGALCAVISAYGRLYEWMSNFLPQVNHELRTPLTAVQGSLGMVLGGMFGQVDSEVREMLEMAHKGCARTIQAINDYLNAQAGGD